MAPVGVGHEDAVGTRGGPDGGIAQLGLRDHDFAAGIVPVAVPLVFDEGVHVLVADGDDGGVIPTDRVGFDADVGQEVEALVDEEVLRGGAALIDGGGDVERAAEGVRAFRSGASQGPFVAVEVVVAGDGCLLAGADAEVTVHGQGGQFYVDHFHHIAEDGLPHRGAIVRGGDLQVVGAHAFRRTGEIGVEIGDAVLDIRAVVRHRRNVGQLDADGLPILRGKEAEVEVQGVVQTDVQRVVTPASRSLRGNRRLVGVHAGHVDAEVLAVEPEASVLLVGTGAVRAVVRVVLEVEPAELHEVGVVVLDVHAHGGRVRATATAFSPHITVGPLHGLVAHLDVAASADLDVAIGTKGNLVADGPVVVVVVVAHVHPVDVDHVRSNPVVDVPGEAVVRVAPVSGDDVVVGVRQLFRGPVDDRLGEGNHALGVDVELIVLLAEQVEGERQSERSVRVVHVDARTAGELLHLRRDLGVGLIRLDPAIAFAGAGHALLLPGGLALEVFGRALVALDHIDDVLLVVALPVAVRLPFIPVHHHDGVFEAAVFAVQRGDVFGQGILGHDSGGQAEKEEGDKVDSHGCWFSRGRNIPQGTPT